MSHVANDGVVNVDGRGDGLRATRLWLGRGRGTGLTQSHIDSTLQKLR